MEAAAPAPRVGGGGGRRRRRRHRGGRGTGGLLVQRGDGGSLAHLLAPGVITWRAKGIGFLKNKPATEKQVGTTSVNPTFYSSNHNKKIIV